MDVIRDVCHSIFLKQCEQIGASFIANQQLKMREESHGQRVKVMVSTLRKLDVPHAYSTCEGSVRFLYNRYHFS